MTPNLFFSTTFAILQPVLSLIKWKEKYNYVGRNLPIGNETLAATSLKWIGWTQLSRQREQRH